LQIAAVAATQIALPRRGKLPCLDAPTAQVLIESKIVEVSTDYMEKLGFVGRRQSVIG